VVHDHVILCLRRRTGDATVRENANANAILQSVQFNCKDSSSRTIYQFYLAREDSALITLNSYLSMCPVAAETPTLHFSTRDSFMVQMMVILLDTTT